MQALSAEIELSAGREKMPAALETNRIKTLYDGRKASVDTASYRGFFYAAENAQV